MIDEQQRLEDLLEESQDLHVDGLRAVRAGLRDLVDRGHERRAAGAGAVAMSRGHDRRTFLRRSLFAAGAVGAGAGAGFLRGQVLLVAADTAMDVQMLQTAAAIENLAIAVYTKAAGLDPALSGASNPVIKQFVTQTIQQHTDHAKAFNAAAQSLGGKQQTGIDQPVYDAVVTPALARITGQSDVLGLAATLEDAAAQTYVRFGSTVDDRKAEQAFATIAPVEAQHAAVLLAVKALVDGGAAQLVALPPDLARLPAAAGSVAFPNTFYKSDAARSADEGALKG